MKIVFCQGKGGVGKSTLAYLFALALSRVGKSISVTDLDPQASLNAWLKDTEGFVFAERGDITIVDTPPRIDDPNVIEAIKSADRIIVPTVPSPAELATAKHSANVVLAHKRPEAKAVVVFNRVKKNTTYGRNLEAMAKSLPLPIAKMGVGDREVFKHVLLDGWNALDSAAKDEIISLALEIQ